MQKQKEKRRNYDLRHSLKERLLSVLLSLAVVLTLMPVMPVKEAEAEAATKTAAKELEPTVKKGKVTAAKVLQFAGKEWYVIGCNGKGVLPETGVTTAQGDSLAVLLAKEAWDWVAFDTSGNSNAYGSSDLKKKIDTYKKGINAAAKNENGTDLSGIIKTRTLQNGGVSGPDCMSEDNISGDVVENATLWPLSAKEAGQIDMTTSFIGQEDSIWWLRSPGFSDDNAAVVFGGDGGAGDVYGFSVESKSGVRPALCINLTSDIFASETNEIYTLTKTAPETTSVPSTAAASATSIKPAEEGRDYFSDANQAFILTRAFSRIFR